MTSDEAVRCLLEALQASPGQLPGSRDAQVGLYRSLVAGRRFLVLLDNARDADQVRPLIPGTPGCLVLVTSRNRLPSLVATEGAHSLTLDLLSTSDAGRLLARRIGPVAAATDPRILEEIVAGCARLPLALTIAAARAATHPGLTLDRLAKELREARGGLDAWDWGEVRTDLRAVFSWSYGALTPVAARLFRPLGLQPGPDITAPAAAGLIGVPVPVVRPVLAELSRANLLIEPAPGRYALHDLLRAYATELAHAEDSTADRLAAVLRILDHYLHTAFPAALHHDPHRDPIAVAASRTGTVVAAMGRTEALAWLSAERTVLVRVIKLAAETGADEYAWQLAWCVALFLEARGHWLDLVTVQSIALAAARRQGQQTAQAHASRQLAHGYLRLGRHDAARPHLSDALELFRELGDRVAEAHTRRSFSILLSGQARHQEALVHARQALELFQAAGHRVGEARTLNLIGWSLAHLADPRGAIVSCRRALVLLREIGDRNGQAHAWDSLGFAHHLLSSHERSVNCYHRALDLFRQIGYHVDEADVLTHLGDAYQAAGDQDLAEGAWDDAASILDKIGHPGVERVRERLHRPRG